MTEVDLQAVDELCRLAVAARRLDCTLHLSGAGPRLRELLDLAGLSDVLRDCPAVLDGSATADTTTAHTTTAHTTTADKTENAPLR